MSSKAHVISATRSAERAQGDAQVEPYRGTCPVKQEHAEPLAQTGSWELRPDEGLLTWSDNLSRIYGYEPGEFTPSFEKVFDRVHPADLSDFAAEIDLIVRTDQPRPPIEYRIIRADGVVRHLRSTAWHVDASTPVRRIIGAVEDRSDSHEAEREIAARIAVSHALAVWESLEIGGLRLLRNFGKPMGFDLGVLWAPKGDMLESRLFWNTQTSTELDLQNEIERTRVPLGVGLWGRAWEQRAPVAVTNVAAEGSYLFRKLATRAGLRGAIAFPAVHEGSVIAVLGFASCEEVRLTERLTDSLMAVGTEIGSFLSHRHGELKPPLLSGREKQVMQLAADGHQGPVIADELGIAVSTIKTHFEHIYEKLGVTDRGNAVAVALREGCIG